MIATLISEHHCQIRYIFDTLICCYFVDVVSSIQ